MPNPAMRVDRSLITRFKSAYMKQRPKDATGLLPKTDGGWASLALAFACMFAERDMVREVQNAAILDFRAKCARLTNHVLEKIEEAGGGGFTATIEWTEDGKAHVSVMAKPKREAVPFERTRVPDPLQLELTAAE